MGEQEITRPSRKLDDFEEFVFECCDGLGSGENWDVCASDSNLRFESATRGPPAKVSFLLNVTPEMSNSLGTLHGGCAATLIDTLSTIILRGVSEPGKFTLGGVSRNLNVTWLRPIPTGTEIRVVCEVIHVGKRLALLRAEIQRANTGDVCVVGGAWKGKYGSRIEPANLMPCERQSLSTVRADSFDICERIKLGGRRYSRGGILKYCPCNTSGYR